MEKINGEYILHCCEEDDPLCLHSITDLISLIHTIGFLPLFSNSIAGFSVEERTTAESWWTGDPDQDPWEWREALASHPDIAYGKFFEKKAGFVSKSWFPVFANYRRSGYDFEALYEDELASFRAKKIMDAFDPDEKAISKPILSSDLKTLAGFRKDGGEQNFEGTLAELQMQTYLIMCDFRQRRNKKGASYGWNLAVLETPETKWGYEFVTSAYEENPERSWQRINEQVKKFFPEAEERACNKVLGITHPGEPKVQSEQHRKRERKKSGEKELSWPENLITKVGLDLVFGKDVYTPLTEDQMAGLEYALNMLKEREKQIVLEYFKEGQSCTRIGETISRSGSRVNQILAKALRKLRNPARLKYYRDGLDATKEKEKQRSVFVAEQLEKMKDLTEDRDRYIQEASKIKIEDMSLTLKSENILRREQIADLGQLITLFDSGAVHEVRVFNTGALRGKEIVAKMEEYGIDVSAVKEKYGLY